MGTKFSLGWLPLGGFIKPLGMSTDNTEKNKFDEAELPFVFFTKPKYLRTLFKLVPWLIYIVAFIVSLILYSRFTNTYEELRSVVGYIVKGFFTMFSDEITKVDFIRLTKEITANKNIVLFGFMLLISIMFLFTPLTSIMNWFSNDEKNKTKIQKAFGFVFTIGIIWLIIWKIPKFIFSFFTFSQTLVYIFSFIVGMFSSGIVFFFATLFIVKSISQNLKEYNIK